MHLIFSISKKKYLLIITLLLSVYSNSQFVIKGKITDEKNIPLSDIVIVYNNAKFVKTNQDGYYTISLTTPTFALKINNINFETFEKNGELISSEYVMNIILKEKTDKLEEIIISTGSRSPRSITTTPLPIDNINTKELLKTNQISLDKALQFKVPSFNTVNNPVRDATTFLDPYEIRNLGPSRTLILINGKRKNLSSLLYIQTSPGRGETGADLSSIPIEAVERIEILRDGASAQYGSDAIAGVMNIILKQKSETPTLHISSGVTSAGDGGNINLFYNAGLNISNKSFFNYTIGYSKTNNAIRSGNIDPAVEYANFRNTDLPDNNPSNIALKNAVYAYINKYPTANNINGTGAIKSMHFLFNAGIALTNMADLYSNASIVIKKINSNANFRPPYWKLDYGLLHTVTGVGENYTGNTDPLYNGYIGYQPSFDGDLVDYNATIGIKSIINKWHQDISFTIGGNKQLYDVGNTLNHGLGVNSPINFKPGGYAFNHMVGNIDFSKKISEKISIAFGSEFRKEIYTIYAGDTASFVQGGANSFPGILQDNASENTRYNIGGYVDLGYDVSKNLLFNGTYRMEDYSDFGDANVFKLSGRYKTDDDKFVFRTSFSTGFRAPTLHQIFAQSTQLNYIAGTISINGLYNNQSKQAKALGIPNLKPENSTNFSAGIGLKPIQNLSITLDFYTINIKDRIVYSSNITTINQSTQLYKILQTNNIKGMTFFINAIETYTSGIDFVLSYKVNKLGSGTGNINFAANYQIDNDVIGQPTLPPIIAAGGATILSTQIKSLLTESRPKYKIIMGLDYSIKKTSISLNNTLFGPTKFQDIESGGIILEHLKQEFSPAIVTDLNIAYNLNKNVTFNISINNVLNILPTWKLVAIDEIGTAYLNDTKKDPILGITPKQLTEGMLAFSGRYKILGYNGSQFSQLGTIFNVGAMIRF